MDRERHKFDLETQQFLVNRWETEEGKRVFERIIIGLKNNAEIRGILDEYVLTHPKNVEPYGFPYYPKEEMTEGRFWVLTSDDLRGITIYNHDFSNSESFEKKSLTYGSFNQCNFQNANLQMTELSYACFFECNLNNVFLAGSGGDDVEFHNCNLQNACIWQCGFDDSDFSGTDLRGVYFENVRLENMTVDYNTKFDYKLETSKEFINQFPPHLNSKPNKIRKQPPKEQADIYRAIRQAYEKAEIWSEMDRFLVREKTAHRKYILWPRFMSDKSISNLYIWLYSFIKGMTHGYTTMPLRFLVIAMFVASVFSAFYFCFGTPSQLSHTATTQPIEMGARILESIYFSLSTFVSLGFGDISYEANHPWLRILSTLEAVGGTIIMAVFVVIWVRKVFR